MEYIGEGEQVNRKITAKRSAKSVFSGLVKQVNREILGIRHEKQKRAGVKLMRMEAHDQVFLPKF